MSQNEPYPADDGRELPELARAVARDAEALVDHHLALARAELREGLRGAAGAALAAGAGAGLVAAGGMLGVLAVVHGLQRATRLPLWSCYALVGGLSAASGVALIASGGRTLGRLDPVPRQTIAALREDVAWIRNRIEPRTG